jgi:hypothetical protein
MRRMTAVTIAALATLALAACSSSSTSTNSNSNGNSQTCSGSTTTSGTARTGDTLTLTAPDGSANNKNEDIAVTVVQVVPSATSAEAGFAPSSGDQWVAVELCVKNLASAPYVDSPNDSVTAIDEAGQSYPAEDDAPTTVGPEFAERLALTTGSSSTGVVTFEVPSGDKIIKLQFAPAEGTGTDVGSWTLG